MHTELIDYKDADTILQGYLAYDEALLKQANNKLPGIMVLHEWFGLGDYVKKRVDMLASLGYIAFAADIYGKGFYARGPEEAREVMTPYVQNRLLLRQRILVGFNTLKQQVCVDSSRMGVIGYCFGGMAALELARSGADVAAVVTFHAALSNPTPTDTQCMKGKVLVCTGADDPYVSAEEIADFKRDMTAANIDWQMITYGGSVLHSFTVFGMDKPEYGLAYHQKADARSWQAMQYFFAEVFSQK